MKQYFLFDLDGTIADNGEGILKSASTPWTPLASTTSRKQNCGSLWARPWMSPSGNCTGFPQEQALEAVKKYRERYHVKGVYENKLYPGVAHLVKTLSQRGSVCLATSKPEVFARKILEMQGILPDFQVVVGAELGRHPHQQGGGHPGGAGAVGAPPKSQAVMIGDRNTTSWGPRLWGWRASAWSTGLPRKGSCKPPGRIGSSPRWRRWRSFASPCVDPRRQGRPRREQ